MLEIIKLYNRYMKPIDLQKFNSNIIDPIKLLFDQAVSHKSYEYLIQAELDRQRDKSNNNAIGNFHQNMFQYVKNCVVPKEGWDVIFDNGSYKIYVEMKNKHNTMNSASSQATYKKMKQQIENFPHDYCYLVEVISNGSKNAPWELSVDHVKCSHEHIRRVSIDRFYKEVTGISDAFYQICMQLPVEIEALVSTQKISNLPIDPVYDELKQINPNLLKSLYLLAFNTYEGFEALKS